MESIADFLMQARVNVRPAPREWTARAVRECDGALQLLTDGIDALIAGASTELGADAARLRSAADRAARAFVTHRDHVATDVSEASADEISCGEEAFSAYIKDGHQLDSTPQDILAYAEDELAQAASRVEGLEPPVFDSPSADSYLSSFETQWDLTRQAAGNARLLTWPDFPIRFVPRPD